MNATKPGYQTTEFWLTLVSQAVPILVMVGILQPEDATGANDAIANAIVAGFAFVGAAVALATYVYNRAKVKAAALTGKGE